MEFTKEEIETAKKVLDHYRKDCNITVGLDDYLDSLLKPETKVINVRIEFPYHLALNVDKVKDAVVERYIGYTESNTKVTELPEVFTREDLEDFSEYCRINYHNIYCLKNWLTGRKSK